MKHMSDSQMLQILQQYQEFYGDQPFLLSDREAGEPYVIDSLGTFFSQEHLMFHNQEEMGDEM